MKTVFSWLLLGGAFIWFLSIQKFDNDNDYSSNNYTTQSAYATELETESNYQRQQRETEAEAQKLEAAEYEKYQNNSLSTGSMPYSYCFGSKNSCSSNCSKINVTAPFGSDVLVSIKKNGTVYRHAYIRSGGSFTFHLPNGSYQPFFYYGNGWNPNKFIKNASCGEIRGGFMRGETVGKDGSQYLNNNILSYTLILQQNGNFSTTPSNKGEAF